MPKKFQQKSKKTWNSVATLFEAVIDCYFLYNDSCKAAAFTDLFHFGPSHDTPHYIYDRLDVNNLT